MISILKELFFGTTVNIKIQVVVVQVSSLGWRKYPADYADFSIRSLPLSSIKARFSLYSQITQISSGYQKSSA